MAKAVYQNSFDSEGRKLGEQTGLYLMQQVTPWVILPTMQLMRRVKLIRRAVRSASLPGCLTS